MKRLLFSALALALCAGGARAIERDSDSVYLIKSAEDLKAFAALVNAGDTTACAKVTCDIDATNCEFTPIGCSISSSGTSSSTFTGTTRDYAGTFDGGGHTITLNINNTSGDGQGLFGYVGSCTIKNVTVAGSVTGRNYVGGIVGMVRSRSSFSGITTIQNCHNTANITGTGSGSDDNGRTVGGIVGIINNEVSFSGSTHVTGGTTEIIGCSNSGKVSGSASSGKVGGIVGFSGAQLTLSRCMNSGEISATTAVGGIIGLFSPQSGTRLEISDCANSGEVKLTSTSGTGGSLMGYMTLGSLTMTTCYNAKENSLPTIGKGTATTTNCYDINSTRSNGFNPFSDTAEELASGALCYNFNGGVSNTVWYQEIGTDTYPVPFTKVSDESNVVNYILKNDTAYYFNTGSEASIVNIDDTKFCVVDEIDATATARSNIDNVQGNVNMLICDTDAEAYTCANAVLKDGTAYSVGVDYTAAKFTYERTLPAGISTFILPISTSASNVSGKVYKLSKYSSGTLTFDDVKDKIEANTPYLVQVENEGSLLTDTLKNVTVKAVQNSDNLSIVASSATHFGSYTNQSINTAAEDNTTYYAYTGGKFYKATGTWTLPPFRTMIKISGSNPAKSLGLQLGDESSGIVSPSFESSPVDVYTASGVRVRSRVDSDSALQGLPTGLYIVGRKKIMKK